MTNAHVVANSTFVAVRRYSRADKFVAKVICIAHDCDLALLSVEDKKFWSGMEPLNFALRVPHLQDKVLVAGYPEGGDTISVTRGIVSRIELGQYTRYLDLLTVQIDAAINPGNSGGPVFSGSEVVGIAFSGLNDADGIGYIIPYPVLQYFLTDYEQNGKWNGFCSLGVRYQLLENKGLKKAYMLPDDLTGILIRYVDPLSPCFGQVVPGDIICSINNTPIADDATIQWRKRERVNYKFLLQQSFPGTKMALQVFRGGELRTMEVINQTIQPLIPATCDAPATYVCWSGLVFVPLSIPFMDSYGGEYWSNAPLTLRAACHNARRNWKDQQVVVLARVLLDEINWGYEEFEGYVVKKVNDVEVVNLRQLYELIVGCEEEFVKLLLGEDITACFRKEGKGGKEKEGEEGKEKDGKKEKDKKEKKKKEK